MNLNEDYMPLFKTALSEVEYSDNEDSICVDYLLEALSIDDKNNKIRQKYDIERYIGSKTMSNGRKAAVITSATLGGIVGLAASVAAGLLVLDGWVLYGLGVTVGGTLGTLAGMAGYTGINEAKFIQTVKEESEKLSPQLRSIANELKAELNKGTKDQLIDKKKVKLLFRKFKKELKDTGVISRVRERMTKEAKLANKKIKEAKYGRN